MVTDLDIREVLEGAKELRVASDQLMAKTHLLQAKAARLTEKNRWVARGTDLLCDSPVCVTRPDDIVSPIPPFEERVLQLCNLEEEAGELVQQLKALLHDRIEELRGHKSSEALGESDAPW